MSVPNGQALPPNAVVIQAGQPPPSKLDWYHGTQSVFLGAVQIICGILSIIFQSLAILQLDYSVNDDLFSIIFAVSGIGIWCGVSVSRRN